MFDLPTSVRYVSFPNSANIPFSYFQFLVIASWRQLEQLQVPGSAVYNTW